MAEPVLWSDASSPLGRHFAAFLERLNGTPCEELRLAARLVCRAVEAGHVCLDLADPLASFRGREEATPVPPSALPELGVWKEELQRCSVVGAPGAFTPLVLDGSRLYLQRYWDYEQTVATFLRDRAGRAVTDLDEVRLAEGLARLFPAATGTVDWQRVAAVSAASRGLGVISGAPGTGKTSTVVKLLALLAEQRPEHPPSIALAAPTGKAAARLMESIRSTREALPCSPEVRALIPGEVSTLHRLLGVIPGSPRFRHDATHRLPHDVVVVDEASMVALPLLAGLVGALKPEARLVLVGDHHQLASVEAGAVLGDLCGDPSIGAFSVPFRDLLGRVSGDRLPGPVAGASGLPDCITVLQTNYRFGDASGIGAVSRALRDAPEHAFELLLSGEHPDATWVAAPSSAGDLLAGALRPVILEGYGPLVRARDPESAHAAFARFQVLCAVRRGPFGVEAVNRAVEKLLAEAGWIEPRGRWYPGRAVLVTRNDYASGLFNGDVGIALPDPAAGGELRVHFPAPDGGLRSVSPGRVPDHETAYAMTVHKSQGSEFERVLLVLPERDSAVLTRELLYTGITRARTAVEVWGTPEVFAKAAARRTVRPSGLRERLWGGGGP